MKSDGGNLRFNYFLGEEVKETIIALKTGWGYYRIYDDDYMLTPPPEQTPCTRDNVTSAWNSSRFGVVVWYTHGSETSASYVMDNYYSETLNDNYPAFTFQGSCLNASPETPVNLAYSLLGLHASHGITDSQRLFWEPMAWVDWLQNISRY
jgi:hypothetical protein